MSSLRPFVIIALVTFTGISGAQPDPAAPAPARIVIRLPADARLYVDDVLFPKPGAVRTVDTPDLEPGEVYFYQIRAEVMRDGQKVSLTKKVSFRAGQTSNLDFGSLAPEGKAAPAVAEKFKLSAEEQETLDLTNKERVKAGLEALRPSEKLFQAAREHSANMARQEKLDHELDGKGPGDRLQAVGYASSGWGENCAAGQRTPAQALESWMNSEGHRSNILSESYLEIGIGVVSSAAGGRYWTQVFGRPADR